MDWLKSIDVALFRLINDRFSNPLLDHLMPPLAGGGYFVLVALIAAALFAWKGGLRARVFVILTALVLFIGDNLVVNVIKHAVDRPRPFAALEAVNLLIGIGDSGSMPSSHASTWAACAAIAWIFYRKSALFLVPMACLMAFSRVYLGVHYPSDVIAGTLLGIGYAFIGIWIIHRTWQWTGPRWFPQWFRSLPSLLDPEKRPASPSRPAREPTEVAWTRLGYALIAFTFIARLLYLAAGKIELSEDETYQWIWSKYLALSYYSKPPLIALTQFLGTSLWGDNSFGVRFFSPVLAAVTAALMLSFLARETHPRAAFFFIVMIHCVPLLNVGAVLMTIDPLLVLFWTTAMICGWRAVQPGGTTRDWLWTGPCMGLAFLSKYSALFMLPCWALFFALFRPARIHLQRPGPYLALLITLLCTLPVLIWNAQHDWITVTHVATTNANLHKDWNPTLRYFWDFSGASAGLLNPVFFGAILWSMVAIWRRSSRRPLELFLFAMGAPVLLGYWLYTFHSRVQPNWIAPAVLPLLALMTTYFYSRWQEGVGGIRKWMLAGILFGAPIVLILHDTNLVGKMTGRQLPPKIDPLRRVRAWSDTAARINRARKKLLEEGKPVFILCAHYGLTGQVTFHLPEAKSALPDEPLVFSLLGDHPENQFYFWPEYRYKETRRGQNAIFARLGDSPAAPPRSLLREFDSVTDLGLFRITYRGRLFRQVQLFECRNLL